MRSALQGRPRRLNSGHVSCAAQWDHCAGDPLPFACSLLVWRWRTDPYVGFHEIGSLWADRIW